MINRNEIALNSSFGRVVNNMFLSHGEGSKNIAVLFPGGDNYEKKCKKYDGYMFDFYICI